MKTSLPGTVWLTVLCALALHVSPSLLAQDRVANPREGASVVNPEASDDGLLLRARPAVSVKGLDLSRAPSREELMAAGQFGGPLYPTHELKDSRRDEASRWAFGRIIDLWNRHEYLTAVELFRTYVRDYPDSPWAAEAELHIGCDALYNGRFSEAEALFEKLITDHQGKKHSGAKMLANKARQRLGLLKVEQNNLEEAGLSFQALLQDSPDWRHRTYASHWLQRLSRYAAAKNALVNCGARALAYALEKQGRTVAAAQVRTNLPATLRGHSLGSLARLSASHGFELAAVQVSLAELPQLPRPAILHIAPFHRGDKGHYWVLDNVDGQRFELFDPQSRHRFQQTGEELSREWNGRALVFATGGAVPGRRLDLEEMEAASGGCCGVPAPEDDEGDPCRNGARGSGSGGDCAGCSEGAPQWSVNMLNLNFFMTDTPIWYEPPIGPPVRITLSYNAQSAIAFNEPFGNKWQFNYASYLVVDTAGTVTLFMPDGRRDTFVPDGRGGYLKPFQIYNQLTKVGPNWFNLRFPDDTVYTYQIPAGTGSQQPMLTEIQDSWGQKLTFGYDDSTRLATITDAQGRITRLTYNADNLVTSVTDPFGRTARFEYSADGNLQKITDMGGYWSSFTYDANVYLSSLSNERGTWTFLTEPADGITENSDNYPPPGDSMYANYRITVTNPLGEKEEFFYYGGCDFEDYNGCSGYSWHVAPRDYVPWFSQYVNNYRSSTPKTRYLPSQGDLNQGGLIQQVIFPEGDSITYNYDAQTGEQTSVTDAHGHTLWCDYNSMGQVTMIKDPNGTITRFAYTSNGVDLLSISDPRGQTALAYNSHHQVIRSEDFLTNATTYAYDDFGRETLRVDALGVTNQYVYEAGGRLSQILAAGKLVASFTYDDVGRIRTRTDATGLTLTYDYNALDALTRITYPDGKFESYDYSSCCPRLLESVSDRSGKTTRYAYDALKRLLLVTTPGGGIFQYGYDANGNMVWKSDANGNRTTFAYDSGNRLRRKTYADGKTLSFAYDQAGLLTNRTDARGISTGYAYNSRHRLTRISYSDGTPGVTNTYDNYGRMVSCQDGIGTHLYTHDAESRVLSRDGPWANDLVTYAYDARGHVTNVVAEGGPTIGYIRDDLRRLTAVHAGSRTYSYLYAGASPLAERLVRPNGSFTTYQYDNLNRLSAVSNQRSSGETISQFLYAYDAQDLRSTVIVSNGLPVSFSANELTRYSHNPLNQLTNTTSPTQECIFDDAGNMTRGYTPEGQVFVAAYDAENHLRSIAYTNLSGEARLTVYAYDHEGLLAESRDYRNSVLVNTARFLRDRFLVLQERNGINSIVRSYTWGKNVGGGIGGLLGMAQAGQDYSYVYDGSGNVESVLDSAQAKAAAYTYDPFGLLLAKAGALDQPIRLATMPFDDGTGLATFAYRSYSTRLGRWLSRDPLGDGAGDNLYAYAQNNPLNAVDPLGLDGSFHTGPEPASGAPIDPGLQAAAGAYAGATIMCDGGGNVAPYVLPSGFGASCMTECLIQHEEAHVAQVNASSPGICAGKAQGTPIFPNTKMVQASGELSATAAEIECLKKTKPSKGPCNKKNIDQRIKDVTRYRNVFRQQFERYFKSYVDNFGTDNSPRIP